MADTDKDALLAQFQDVTGAESDRANFFLESSNWNLEVALGSFFENDGEAAVIPMEAAVPPPAATAAQAPAAEPAGTPPASQATPPRQPASRGGIGANVVGVGAGRADDEEMGNSDGSDESDDEPGQAFYAGGSSTSGQQILGPPKKKTGSGFVKDVFKKAREAGAEAVEPGTSGGKKQGASAFTGTGFKLGSSETDPSQKIEGAKKPKPPREFVLKMWRNGFSIDDGELRPYNDPNNRAFLSAVMGGSIPEELVHMAEGGEVHVDMEDHKEEEYTKPKGGRRAFTGTGNVLGGIAPAVASAGASAAAASAAPADPAAAEKEAQAGIKVDTSAAVTSVQIRLPDGKRLVVKLNQDSHTVGDIRRFVAAARPDYGAGGGFSLHTTYPPKELADEKATIKDAGLVGAALLLRKK